VNRASMSGFVAIGEKPSEPCSQNSLMHSNFQRSEGAAMQAYLG
jgi:hypothetical protein